MKKLLLFIFTASAIGANAQNVNIPDANFKAYLLGEPAINTSNDSEIQVSEAAAYTGGIFCANLSIADLTGIEAFTSLTTLECDNNSLTNLNVSSNVNLTTLHCGGNWIGSLDVSSNVALTYLNMVNNNISMLDVSNNINLTTLNCGINALSALDVVNCPDLIELYCQTNSIAILDLSMQTSLQYFQCPGNLLTGIDFSNGNNANVVVFNTSNNPNLTCIQVDDAAYSAANWTNIDPASSFSTNCAACSVNIPDANFKAYLVGNTAINTNSDSEIQCTEASAFTGIINCQNLSISDLTGIEAFTMITSLSCRGNSLSTINLSQNTMLEVLDCADNSLSSLDLSQNIYLSTVYCFINQIATLDFAQNTVLETLSAGDNPLTSLDVSQNAILDYLILNNAQLTSINLANNPALSFLQINNNQLTQLDVSNNTSLENLQCTNNQFTSLDFSNHTVLTALFCNNNALTSLNIANGNNTNVTSFQSANNPNLTCIQVDDVTYSTANWISIDAASSFSTNCAGNIGINETFNLDINIFPNPTTGIVTFSSTESIATLEIYNLTGQKVNQFSNTKTIDISNLPSGIYTATIQTKSGKTALKKLVKE